VVSFRRPDPKRGDHEMVTSRPAPQRRRKLFCKARPIFESYSLAFRCAWANLCARPRGRIFAAVTANAAAELAPGRALRESLANPFVAENRRKTFYHILPRLDFPAVKQCWHA
jgi:hypothetical protein